MATPDRPALDESDSVVLNGSGNGTVEMRPDGSKEYWYPEIASVSAPNPAGGVPTHEAKCEIFIGRNAAQAKFVDASYSGSSGDSSGHVAGYVIGRNADPKIIAVWTGGDPGATATLRIRGTKMVRG